MNVVILMGRLCQAPEIRQTDNTTVGSYTLAVDRFGKDKGADFIRCKTFGKSADFAQQYLKKGMKIAVEGRINTNNYTNRDGQKVYTTEVIVNAHHFCEGKGEASAPAAPSTDDFMSLPIDAESECPFE